MRAIKHRNYSAGCIKFTLELAKKAQRESRDIALLFP
jgi:hypothetical protein